MVSNTSVTLGSLWAHGSPSPTSTELADLASTSSDSVNTLRGGCYSQSRKHHLGDSFWNDSVFGLAPSPSCIIKERIKMWLLASASLFRALFLLWEVPSDTEYHRHLDEIEHRHSTLQQGAAWDRLELTAERCHKTSP